MNQTPSAAAAAAASPPPPAGKRHQGEDVFARGWLGPHGRHSPVRPGPLPQGSRNAGGGSHSRFFFPFSKLTLVYINKKKVHVSCGVEGFVETHLSKAACFLGITNISWSFGGIMLAVVKGSLPLRAPSLSLVHLFRIRTRVLSTYVADCPSLAACAFSFFFFLFSFCGVRAPFT